MGWGFGRTLDVGGLNFLVLPVLRRMAGPKSNPSVTYGVVTGHLRKLSQIGIARMKEASIVDLLDESNGNPQWNITFLRAVHDREVEAISEFYNLIYYVLMRGGGEDKLFWRPSAKVKFKVCSFYQSISKHNVNPFSWKSI